MAASYGAEIVKCPFYKDETKNTIKCEGDFSCSCIHTFKSSKNKYEYKEEFCNVFNYKKCSLFKNVMTKYAPKCESENKRHGGKEIKKTNEEKNSNGFK